jgi:hypothetical protein
MSDDRLGPATRGDLQDLRTELKGDMSSLRNELKGDMSSLRDEVKGDIGSVRDELIEAIHDGQTALLKAFYGFSETVRNRFQEQDQTEVSLKRRMSTLEDRMVEIEKRLNMPPAA